MRNRDTHNTVFLYSQEKERRLLPGTKSRVSAPEMR
jgi:hypothetical protein